MNTYLKYKPVWYRVFVLGTLIVGSTLLLGLLSTYLISNIMGISMQDLQGMDFSEPGMGTAQKIIIVANSFAIFLIPAILYAYFTDPRPLHFLRLNTRTQQRWHWGLAVVIILVAIPSAFWLGELNKTLDVSKFLPGLDKWMRESEDSSNKIVEAFLKGQDLKGLFINLLVLAAVPAVSEELFFRGLVQKGIIRSTRNVWLGILLSAFIFSAIHFQFLTFLTRFEMGIILGALFWYSGNLWVPILAHFVFNGLQVLMAYWKPEMTEIPDQAISAGWVGMSFLFLVLLIIVLRKSSQVSMYEVFDDEDDFNLDKGSKDEYLL